MLLDDKPYTVDRIFRLGIGAALLWGGVWLLQYLSDALIPFAVAFLLAYLINPLVVLIKKKITNHAAAVFISLFIVALAGLVILMLVLPMIVGEVKHMGKVFSGLVNNSELAKRAASLLPANIWQWVREILAQDEIQQFFKTDSFLKAAQTVAKKVLPGVWGLITGTTSFLMGVVGLAIIGLYLVFLLLDYNKVKEGWKDLLPPQQKETIVTFIQDFDEGMNRYFRAQAAVASIVGVLFAIGFTIIGLPMGILLGLFIGLLNMVPYLQMLGMPPALILAVVHALETGSGIWTMIVFTLLVFAVVQAIQDGFLVPKIMGQTTGLSPAMILLSLSIWGKLLGMFGLLIALPMTALLTAYYRRFLANIRKTSILTTDET